MRLDKYLKVSRIIKRRTVAAQAADLGRIQINGKVAKPSTEVKEGDELDILMGGKHMRGKVISVRAFAPKAEAAAKEEILGDRMGRDKLSLSFGGKSPVELSIEAFSACPINIEGIIVATSAANTEAVKALCSRYEKVHVIAGGASRGESAHNCVREALRLSAGRKAVIAIHDAARCLVDSGTKCTPRNALTWTPLPLRMTKPAPTAIRTRTTAPYTCASLARRITARAA